MRIFFVITIALISGMLPISAAERINPADIAVAARTQIGKTVRYNPGYLVLDYPNGDVPIETGVCTDVVVRALRTSL